MVFEHSLHPVEDDLRFVEVGEERSYARDQQIFGIVIKMIFHDDDKHHKPHVHFYYGEYEASVALDGEVLEGKIPLKQYSILAGCMAIHEEELYEAWNQAVRAAGSKR